MALDGKCLAEARALLEQRREANAEETAKRRREALRACPGLAELERERRSVSMRLVRAGIDGGADFDALEAQGRELNARRARLLAAHGISAESLEDIYSCPVCRDRGYTESGRLCSCLRELYEGVRTREMSRMLKTGDDSFDSFDLTFYSDEYSAALGSSPRAQMQMVYDNCRVYAEKFSLSSPNLLLRGGTGLGKTRLSACIARTVSEKGFSVVYDTAGSVFDVYETRRFSRDGDKADEAERGAARFSECDLFILDDLGTEMTTSLTQSALYTLVNTRLNAGRPTIINTNLSPSELAKRYMPQTVSRLEGEFVQLRFYGSDIRAIKLDRKYYDS
ncbi:MAG: ATP-binding protein [Oscillospiraceae bacterium]|nr:ATP-binding protein [Oscillospiraceae bacterium]